MSKPIFATAFADTIAPQVVDTFTPLGYEPTARQQVFHTLSQDRINAILYGGSGGGGKSVALLQEAIYCAVNFPRMRIGCFRRTYGELEESFLAPLGTYWSYARPLGAKWNASTRFLKFPNDSVINFSYAENEVDASRILGGEYQLFCIDEAGQTPPTVIQHIEERLRSGRRDLPVIGLRLATNPMGVSHTYLKKRFVDATDRGAAGVVIDDNERSVAFVPAKASDNPHLDAGYFSVLDAISDPIRRRQMRDGDWSVAAGMFFEQWSEEAHVISSEDMFDIPQAWTKYCGIDYGIRDPWAVIWAAVDPDGRVWCYREIYAQGIDIENQAKYILEAEQNAGDKDVIRVMDPSCWGNMGTNMSIADVYGLNGCGVGKATNHRPNGWSRVHHLLNPARPACAIHKARGWDACPLLHVFGPQCPMFVETMPSLPRTELRSDDAKTKNVADHMPDATRYLSGAIGTMASPIFYDQDNESPQPIEPQQAADYPSDIQPMPLVAGRFSGNLGMGL